MRHVPEHIQSAAFEGHMATIETLKASLGRAPTYEETLLALAEAFCDMMGIYAGTGAQPHQIEAVNRIVQRAYTTMLSKIMAHGCDGSARRQLLRLTALARWLSSPGTVSRSGGLGRWLRPRTSATRWSARRAVSAAGA